MRSNRLELKNVLYTLIFLLVSGLVIFGIVGGIDPEGTRRTLENMGYTNVQTFGRRFLARTEHEFYSTEFTAISPNGRQVSGVVTKGFIKPSTVRWD